MDIGSIVFLVTVLGVIVYKTITSNSVPPAKPKTPGDYHSGAIKRTARGTLWVMFPPLGLWRSYRHGRRKGEQRIVDEIRKNRNAE